MKENIITAVISAVVAGFVSFAIVFFMGGTSQKAEYENLEVKSLTVTDKIVLHNLEKQQDEIVMENGTIVANSVVANNKLIATQVLGTQLAGHVVVGNRLFATPNKLDTPVESWKMYTEIGANEKTGGELIVRSPNGANLVGKGINGGNLVYLGFQENDGPAMFVQKNQTEQSPLVRAPFLINVPPNSTASDTGPAYTKNAEGADREAVAQPPVNTTRN